MIGEFEYIVLAAARRLGDQAYGASISEEVQNAIGRRCSVGALYTTLDRLESKGLIKTEIGNPTPERGGRAKRMVTISGAGRRAAFEFQSAITRISEGIRWEASSGKRAVAIRGMAW